MIDQTYLIFYVADQTRSVEFYKAILQIEPIVDEPGMTEFLLRENVILGVMPAAGIVKLHGDAMPDPTQAQGIPRSELYLLVDDPVTYHQRALDAGAQNIKDLATYDWGHEVAYCLDLDGHMLAFARNPVMSESYLSR